jgi:hypothetical protein
MDAGNAPPPDGAFAVDQVVAAAGLLGVVVDDDDLTWLANAMAEQRKHHQPRRQQCMAQAANAGQAR